jgi:hypothetical protein
MSDLDWDNYWDLNELAKDYNIKIEFKDGNKKNLEPSQIPDDIRWAKVYLPRGDSLECWTDKQARAYIWGYLHGVVVGMYNAYKDNDMLSCGYCEHRFMKDGAEYPVCSINGRREKCHIVNPDRKCDKFKAISHGIS